MDSQKLHSLITKVPTITRRVDLNALTTTKGVQVRTAFALFALIPLVAAFDQNGGLLTLGFSRGTTLER